MGQPINVQPANVQPINVTPPTWRFGVFEIDGTSGQLRRNGSAVKLREQSARILLYLLENAGQLITRDELRRILWPADTFVDFDHSLNTAVMKLREALGDSASTPLYIQTIPKRGYRFIAPVSFLTPVLPSASRPLAEPPAPVVSAPVPEAPPSAAPPVPNTESPAPVPAPPASIAETPAPIPAPVVSAPAPEAPPSTAPPVPVTESPALVVAPPASIAETPAPIPDSSANPAAPLPIAETPPAPIAKVEPAVQPEIPAAEPARRYWRRRIFPASRLGRRRLTRLAPASTSIDRTQSRSLDRPYLTKAALLFALLLVLAALVAFLLYPFHPVK